jgi:hypothetical protein
MAGGEYGIRLVAVMGAASVLWLVAPAAAQAAPPPPPPPDPHVLVAQDRSENTSIRAARDDLYGLGVSHTGINAWLGIIDQSR